MSPVGSVITVDVRSDGHPGVPPTAFDVTREYDAHGPALFGFAVNALRDRGLAEDCVQETFLRAWRARERFDSGRASARTWLFAIERNVIADLLRSLERMPRLTSDDTLDQTPAAHPDQLERLGMTEALAKLSDEHRQAVIAVHLTGRSYSEISTETGVPVSTIRTRVFYGLRALRDHLDGKGLGE
jgi:RNA polymerase sigma-70 factor (ECF subfamily)